MTAREALGEMSEWERIPTVAVAVLWFVQQVTDHNWLLGLLATLVRLARMVP